ncbi:MAG TPA: hypothetical protein VGU21_09855 [Streptosporangiaceae bacterium]|nr:hypothetical protein [Streptosporangiaceae bacterium]
MATRPAKTRPAQAQSAKVQSAKAQAVKARSATAQAAKAQAKTQAANPQAANPQAAEPSQPVAPPRELRLAAAVQALEAVGMFVAAGFAAAATVRGQSYERASGIALTLIAVGTAALFAAFARGLAKAQPWTRTPVVMTQLAIGSWAVFLLTAHRYQWAVPMLLVAAAILAALFTPASLRALNRPARQP